MVAPAPPQESPAPSSSVPPTTAAGRAADQAVRAQPVTTTSTTTVDPDPPVTDTTAPTTTTTLQPADPPTTPVDPNQPYQGPEAESLAFVNQKRAEQGRATLQVDPRLTELARGWASQLAADKNLRHNPNLGDEVLGGLGYRAAGENVGYAGSASAIDEGWWNSDGHRRNILSRDFHAIGIAFVVDDEGTYWGVQVFAGN